MFSGNWGWASIEVGQVPTHAPTHLRPCIPIYDIFQGPLKSAPKQLTGLSNRYKLFYMDARAFLLLSF